MNNKLLKYLKKTNILLRWLIFNSGKLITDKLYLSFMYRFTFGRVLDWHNPKTFNEKINWIKLYDRKPEYTNYVDKYKVREYIAKTIGEQYLIPLIGVWDNPDEIDFDKLPNQFVLKCNHNSGLGMCICKDKTKLNIKEVKKELRKGLAQDYYLSHREWAYKDVPHKIIAEKYMVDESGYELKDYKVMVFNGKARYVRVCFNRFKESGLNINWYDLDWNFCDIRMVEPPDRSVRHEKPKCLKEMIELSEKIAKDMPFARVDWYIINNKLYSGEITLYPDAGFGDFEPQEYDEILGSYVKLPANLKQA